MIDTIRFRFPLNDIREAFFKQISTTYMQVSPSGKIINEYLRFKPIPEDELTTQFRHKFISINRDFLVIEFSLHKMINDIVNNIRLNHNNFPLPVDISFFLSFINSINKFPVEVVNNETGEIEIKSINLTLKEIEIMKIDYGINFELETNINFTGNIFEFIHIHLGRIANLTTEKYRGGIFHKSEYKAIKLYSKFEDVKHQIKQMRLSSDVEDLKDKEKFKEILPSLKNIYRFEISYKKKCLNKKSIGIFSVNGLYKLKKDFESDMEKIINLTEFKKIKKKQRLTLKERELLSLVKKYGYTNAREKFLQEFSRPTFYRVQKQLKEKGINLKNISPEIYYKYNVEEYEDFYIEFKRIPC